MLFKYLYNPGNDFRSIRPHLLCAVKSWIGLWPWHYCLSRIWELAACEKIFLLWNILTIKRIQWMTARRQYPYDSSISGSLKRHNCGNDTAECSMYFISVDTKFVIVVWSDICSTDNVNDAIVLYLVQIMLWQFHLPWKHFLSLSNLNWCYFHVSCALCCFIYSFLYFCKTVNVFVM